MRFRVCGADERIICDRELILLRRDNWDDFGFKTTFEASYFDILGREHPLGPVQIGMKGMRRGWTADHLSREFIALSDDFFSLGQDDVYYSNIAALGDRKRETILTALQDVAFDLIHYSRCRNERVMQESLLRSRSSFAVEGQLHRMAQGGVRLTNYRFSYVIPGISLAEPTRMDFEVTPGSNPPTNVHVLIGRNGTGKTRLLRSMISSIRFGDASWGRFAYTQEKPNGPKAEFANILCVAFSPFDDFSEIEEKAVGGQKASMVPWSFIGLNKQLIGPDKKYDDLKQAVAEQFYTAFENCMSVAWKRRLWLDAIEVLKSDRTFAEERIDDLAPDRTDIADGNRLADRKGDIMKVFSRLSSGHKVVLLIVTGCVDKIEEQSIVFLDEPENHLHPPLLSALIRALSNLLMHRNGVAVVSTHSPVVLQEVPSRCVWTLHRHGDHLNAERPAIQTFGATIGSLTNEVFGLEVTDSGFHRLLREAVRQLGEYRKTGTLPDPQQDDYEKIAGEFDGQLGDEADILLRTLLALRRRGQDR